MIIKNSVERYVSVYAKKLGVSFQECLEAVQALVAKFIENIHDARFCLSYDEFTADYGGIKHLMCVEEVKDEHIEAVMRWVGPTQLYLVIKDYAVL